MPNKKFYVVWAGRETSVFDSWLHTQALVTNYPHAKYKSFKTKKEAEAAYTAGPSATYKSKEKKINKSTVTNTGSIKEKNVEYDVSIYCDGACDPNPGEAGSGVAIYRKSELAELWYGLYNPNGTNNTAELNALNQALHFAKEEIDKGRKVQILCDSKYSIDCITNWAFNWEKKGWKRKKEGDIKNLEIIQQAHELYKNIMDEVTISHVYGHVGVEGNELADRMSVYGIDQQDSEFSRYTETLDILAILNFRSG